MNKELLELLKTELIEIKNATEILKISFDDCQEIGIKDSYEINELLNFEGLTARFSRLSDIITQKCLRTISEIELEFPDSVRDLLNVSEKKGIINDAYVFSEIRKLRNRIVHEYVLEELEKMFGDVLKLTPALLSCSEIIIKYCNGKYKFNF